MEAGLYAAICPPHVHCCSLLTQRTHINFRPCSGFCFLSSFLPCWLCTHGTSPPLSLPYILGSCQDTWGSCQKRAPLTSSLVSTPALEEWGSRRQAKREFYSRSVSHVLTPGMAWESP